jgi:GxxExxY protein
LEQTESAEALEKPHWDLTHQIIGAAYEVHRTLGPGFLERVYSAALLKELADAGLSAVAEAPIPVIYKGTEIGLYYADILVEQTVVCEIKAVKSLNREHEAQLLHYLKATGLRVGLLVNFGAKSAEVKRMMLQPERKSC